MLLFKVKVTFMNVIFFVGLLTSCVTSVDLTVSSFECFNVTACDRIVSVVQDGDSGCVYITTMANVKKLNEDLLQQLERKTVVEPQVQNVLTILRGTELLTCKNDQNGTCELRDVETLDVLSPEKFRQTGIVYPGKNHRDIIGWIPGGVGNQLVIAVSNKATREGSLSLTLVAARSLPEDRNLSADGFLQLFTDEFNIPSSKFHAVSCLSDEIEPFYGFTSGNHNYILKRQTSVAGETTIKLIRICKGSPNFWSYIELPVQCNENQAAVESSQDDIVYSAAYFTNDTLYISITKQRNNMTQQVVSHVCGYNITTLNEHFVQRRRECLEGATESTELTWHLQNYCPQKSPTQFNFSLLNDPDYCYNEPFAQPLGGSKPIQATALLNIQEVITALLVIEPTADDNFEETEYLLGDNVGNVHRFSSTRTEVEVVDAGHSILEGSGLLLHRNRADVYASSDRKIVKLSVINPWTTDPPPKNRDTSEEGDESRDDDDNNNTDIEEDGGKDDNNHSIIIYYVIDGSVVALIIIVIIVIICVLCRKMEEKQNWKI